MKRHPATGGYAEALLAVAEDQKQSAEIGEELEVLREIFSQSKDFRVLFESPKIARREKEALLDRVLGGRVSQPVLNLLKTLVRRSRQLLFSEICDAYRDKLDVLRGRAHVMITSATTLSEDLRREIIETLGRKTGRTIVSQERVDGDLLGGVRIQMGDTVIDGSVRTRLNQMREALAAPRIGSEIFQ